MKLYLGFLLVFLGCYADDEIPDEFASLLSELSHDLEKRLTDHPDGDAFREQLDQNSQFNPKNLLHDRGSSCYYKLSEQRIIRTHDSLSNGAVYIDSTTNILNITACRAECCSRPECDLAVFKDKGDEHACYLFTCNKACLFTNHSGFSTMEKKRNAEQHEADLANLATDPPSTSTEKPTTTTIPTTTLTPSINLDEKVPLFGTCIQDQDCAGSKTECLAGYCVCQQGTHAQEGVCREECSRFQYECANEGRPLAYPQCIAIYDTCDGIPHCHDGSDELKCDLRGSSSSDPKTVGRDDDDTYDELASLVEELLKSEELHSGQKGSPNRGSKNQGQYPGHRLGSGNGRQNPSRPKTEQQPSQQLPKPNPPNVAYHRPEATPDQTETPHPEPPAVVDQQPSDNIRPQQAPHHPPSTDLGQKIISVDPPKQQPSSEQAGPRPQLETLPPTTSTQTPIPESNTHPDTTIQNSNINNNNKKPPHSGGGSGQIVAKHVAPDGLSLNEVEPDSNLKASNKTAVVVLAMGLGVTAMLLIFVGCRLRMVKRRLRRGRPLNTNEADYLINGMYL